MAVVLLVGAALMTRLPYPDGFRREPGAKQPVDHGLGLTDTKYPEPHQRALSIRKRCTGSKPSRESARRYRDGAAVFQSSTGRLFTIEGQAVEPGTRR